MLNGAHNIYCSDECKYSCNIYKKRIDKEIEAFNLGLSLTEYELMLQNSKDLILLKCVKDEAKKRDGYVCQNCNSKKDLHGHHIKPIALCLGTNDEYLIYDTSNIITLCSTCHYETHSGDISLNNLKNHKKNSICYGENNE